MPSLTPRIYVACLSSYNNAKLHGKWIDANQSPEMLQIEIDVMLGASPEPGAEEWAIHDSEDLGNISEHESLENISDVAALIVEHEELGLAVLKYHCGRIEDAKNALENYAGTFRSLEDWAEEFLEDTGMFQGADNTLKTYFDYGRWVNDAELGGDIYTIDLPSGGIAVFHNH